MSVSSQQPDGADVEAATDAPDSEELVTISRWELEALRTMAAGSARAVGVSVTPVKTEPVAPAACQDEETGRKAAELERAYKAAIRDRELATALAGRNLVPGAAAQLIKLWRDDFDVYEADGELCVTARDGRPVAKAVAERLAEVEFAHFSPPPSRGGAVGRGPSRAGLSAPPTAPRTLGEAALLRWREAASARSDPSSTPIGLRRR